MIKKKKQKKTFLKSFFTSFSESSLDKINCQIFAGFVANLPTAGPKVKMAMKNVNIQRRDRLIGGERSLNV